GKSYLFEPVRYGGTPQMITALANGELEIANLAFSTLPIAIQNAGLGLAMRTMLRRHGLEDKRDYVMVEAPLATMRGMLADRKADLVMRILTFAPHHTFARLSRP